MSEFKAIDFHIHTVKSISDSIPLDFDIDRLKEYVVRLNLKAIAITNHNLFNKEQFETIKNSLADLDVVVFPGIELDIEKSHLLIISPAEEIASFSEQCNNVTPQVTDRNYSMKYDEFESIFGESIGRYLLIPHYKKSPSIRPDTLSKLGTQIIAGEVQNPKKFELMKKDTSESLSPVMFSDVRMNRLADNESEPAPKVTFLKIDNISIPNLKIALSSKENVALTKNGDNRFVLDHNMTTASLGLNVILGCRSSGKTHLLDSIANIYGNDDILYIKQFEIIKQCDDDGFKKLIDSQYNNIVERYLSGIKTMTDVVLETEDEGFIDTEISRYLESLKKYAKDAELRDDYASAKLFNENEYNPQEDNIGTKILDSLQFIIEHADYGQAIQQSIPNLKKLFLETIKVHREKNRDVALMREVDNIIQTTKNLLESKSSISPIHNPDLYKVAKAAIINKRFDTIINKLRKESELKAYETTYGRFRISVTKKAYSKVSDIQKNLNINEPHKSIFNDYYSCPHKFVKALKDSREFSKPHLIPRTLINIEVNPVKKDGNLISKGERAEFVLMNKLEEAKNYQLFLFDEPEPSFDNPFIGEEVIKSLKHLSLNTTVFVATHNNTIGASIDSDGIVLTKEENDRYSIYTGSLTSDKLNTYDGNTVKLSDVLLELLESGKENYSKRRRLYGNIND